MRDPASWLIGFVMGLVIGLLAMYAYGPLCTP